MTVPSDAQSAAVAGASERDHGRLRQDALARPQIALANEDED
jgi:hypothetical protein